MTGKKHNTKARVGKGKVLKATKAKAKKAKSSVSDKNKNVDRKESKNAWKRFRYALANLPKGAPEKDTYENLSRAAKTRFQQMWEKDPSWQFVKTFKVATERETTKAESRVRFLSFRKLCNELGRLGAKRRCKLMRTKGRFKTLESGTKLYEYPDDVVKQGWESTKEKRSELSAETTESPADYLGGTKSAQDASAGPPLALMDAPSTEDTPEVNKLDQDHMMYVCMYVCAYTYVHIYTGTQTYATSCYDRERRLK